jgi:hypothetical protein
VTLKAAARKELEKQIAALEPNAAKLNSAGFGPFLSAELVRAIQSGSPDITILHAQGLGQKDAVEVCTAIAARHAPKAEPMPAPVVKPVPLPKLAEAAPMPPLLVAPAPVVQIPTTPAPKREPYLEPVGELAALSLLHTLVTMVVDSGRADITLLIDHGFSPSTSAELTNLIACAHPHLVSNQRYIRSPS